MKKMKHLAVVCGLMGLGLFTWGTITPAWGAVPTITFIDSQAASGGMLYIDHANTISLNGTGAGNSNTVHIEVDGAEVQTVVSGAGGDFNCNFNAPDIDAAQIVRAWVVATQYSNEQNIIVDTDDPDLPDIHWQAPADGAFVGPNLSEIRAAVNDTGGSGIDWGASTLVLGPGMAHGNSHAGGNIYFNPTNGWPESDGSDDKDFTDKTTYIITATIYDRAGNVRVNTGTFTFDYVKPSITEVHWHNPATGAYVGPNLSEIRAAVNDTGGSGIDWGASTLVLGPGIAHGNSHAGGNIYFTPDNDWPESDGSDSHDFADKTEYTITATIQDNAGNVSVNNTNSFIFDYVKPSITEMHWHNPATGAYVGPNLSEIRAAVNDTGGSGIDWGASTLVLGPGIAHGNSHAGGSIYFNPTNGWPESDGSDDKDFTDKTTYLITATIQDNAGNISVNNTNSFIFDYVKPSITEVHRHNPATGAYVGPNLSEIRAAVNDTGGSGIDWGASTLVLGPGIDHTNSNSLGSIYFHPTNGWPESDGSDAKDFTHSTTYLITATIQDNAGNVSVNNANSFIFDYVDPVITDIHWQAPMDHTHVGPNLSAIWAPVSDALSGIDWENSTLVLGPVIAHSNSHADGNIYFAPDNDWPESDGSDSHDFADKTNYTVTAVIRDFAGNENTRSENFRFDYTRPTAEIHWQNTYDCSYVGPNLSAIWSIVGDPAPFESGIDWARSTVSVSGIGGTNDNNLSNRIDFNPTGEWPESDGSNAKDFTHNERYTVTATIYDTAENVYVITKDFRFDYQNPVATIQWEDHHRGTSPPSYYMGEDLNRIWAVLNQTVTETDFGDAIDYSNTTISITPAPSAGAESDGGHIIDWSITTPPDYHTRFVNGTFYSVTIVVQDLAGNKQTYARYFMKDEDPPVIGDIKISDISGTNGVLNANNRVIRGTHFPLAADNFMAYITDTKGGSDDWGVPTHTSLNGSDGSDISHHSYQPSEMRLYYEGTPTPLIEVAPTGINNNYTADSGTAYRGLLTLPGNYAPISGVYSISVCARDWANHQNHHRDMALPRFLVDDIPPGEDGVFPTQSTESPNPPYVYFSLNGDKYIRSYDLINDAPQKVSVYAHDAPFDRNSPAWFPDCPFPDRLNLTASWVKLFNPDGDEYTINSAAGWERIGTDRVNVFMADINETYPPIFPIPEYIGNTIEGRYTIRIHLEDTISADCGAPNTRDVDYYFFNDLTPPRLISWDPFSTIPRPDTYSSNFPDVQASIMDPDLRAPFSGGTVYSGSGLNLTACAVEIYAGLGEIWKNPEDGHIHADGPFTGPQDQLLNGEQVSVFEIWDIDELVGVEHGRRCYVYVTATTVEVDGENNSFIDITGLTNTAWYVIGWRMPAEYRHDGLCVIGSLPNEKVLKDGFYFANCFAADMVGNTTQVESIYFHYHAAGGLITLTADPHVVPADGVSEAVVTTSPVYLRSYPETLVQQGTLITVSSSLGDIITPDADTILDGIQVITGSDGRVEFTVRSRARESGVAALRAKSASGFADSGDVTDQLEFVLTKMYNGRVEVKPAMEGMTAEYQIEAHVNSLNALADGVDAITIQFPEGTGLPAAVSSGNLLLNNVPISGSDITGRDLSFKVPITLPKNSLFTVLLLETAGIINPAAGHYMLKIKSSQNCEFLDIPYDILISIRDEEMVPAPNPSSLGRVRFFFNLDGPARVELFILNLLGDKISCITERYSAAKKGEVLDWNTLRVGPGVYWALMKIHYDDGRTISLRKRKVVIIVK